jgi:hypothetical protein
LLECLLYKEIINVLENIDNRKELIKVYVKLSILYLEYDDIVNCGHYLKKIESIMNNEILYYLKHLIKFLKS